jgi:arylsulfatase
MNIEKNKMNVLLIMTDQQSFDTIEALGNSFIKTPAMNRLVSEGTVFTNAYTAYPVCGPARAAIFTGRMPSECGV